MKGTLGINTLWCVLSISGPKSMSRPGMMKKTEPSAKNIDLIRQMAISGPTLNCMNSMAMRPPMVVRLDAPISGMPLESASMTASRSS